MFLAQKYIQIAIFTKRLSLSETLFLEKQQRLDPRPTNKMHQQGHQFLADALYSKLGADIYEIGIQPNHTHCFLKRTLGFSGFICHSWMAVHNKHILYINITNYIHYCLISILYY